MQTMERAMLRYLGKALPGYDFASVLPPYQGA